MSDEQLTVLGETINELFEKAETIFLKMSLRVEASVTLSGGYILSFRRANEGWKFVVINPSGSAELLKHKSVLMRTEAADAVPKLYERLKEASDDRTRNLRNAIDSLDGFLDSLEDDRRLVQLRTKA